MDGFCLLGVRGPGKTLDATTGQDVLTLRPMSPTALAIDIFNARVIFSRDGSLTALERLER